MPTASTGTLKPFRLDAPSADLDDLRARLARTRWPAPAPDDSWASGVPVTYLQELAAYWRDDYDWRAQESELNQHPQFTTEIDGQNVHFLHVRSPEPTALPVILIHGWPGSVVEFLDVIRPMTDPVAHGCAAREAFHLVIPSIPGFGLSGPTTDGPWTTDRIAGAFHALMTRLGYQRYGAQGGDAGAGIAPAMGHLAPQAVVGVHVNAASMGFMPFPPLEASELASLSEPDQRRVARIERFISEEFGYAQLQSTKPYALAYGLTDSPVGQLAWIVDRFKSWTFPESALPEAAIDRDRLLTNVMLYWLTGTAGSSAYLYYADAQSASWDPPQPSGVPTGVATFAEDISIRRYAEHGHNIVHWSDFDRGGHFAAMEAPDLLVEDIRTFFASLREADRGTERSRLASVSPDDLGVTTAGATEPVT